MSNQTKCHLKIVKFVTKLELHSYPWGFNQDLQGLRSKKLFTFHFFKLN